MNIVRIQDLPLNVEKTAVTVGGFDGVHMGHQRLLNLLKKISISSGIPSVLVTFEIPPQLVTKSKDENLLLMTLEEKLKAIEKFGIDYILLLEFTDKIRNISAEEFIEKICIDGLKSSHIIIGFNHKFGKDREGNPEFLVKSIDKLPIILTVLPPVRISGQLASSSRIRQLLLSGFVEEANKLLGKSYALSGKVIEGEGLGRGIGIPTANLKPVEKLIPKDGVYVVEVETEKEKFGGVLNIGVRPTVDGIKRQIEVHIMDFAGDLKEKEITLYFLHRLRNEIKFPSLDALKEQILRDIEKAKAIISRK